jgi:hypothetical protein
MAAKYIKSSSALSPKNVWDKLNAGDWSFDDCPWVITGNLFSAVNFTGDGSWQEIVVDLFKKGQVNFAVLAGRHGDQLGQEIDTKTGKFAKRSASDGAINPADDQKVATRLQTSLKGLNIVVRDVGSGAHDTVDLLKQEIQTQLSANRIVILAWCYSLYAMKPGWDSTVKSSWPQVFNGPNMTPISWIAKDWDWVTMLGMFPATAAANNQGVA